MGRGTSAVACGCGIRAKVVWGAICLSIFMNIVVQFFLRRRNEAQITLRHKVQGQNFFALTLPALPG
jgi:hypothetical protein